MVTAGGRETLVVLANRLPIERVSDDGAGWRGTTGGLVTLLEPVVRDADAIWIGYAGTSQASTVDHDGLRLLAVGLSEADFPGYYEGYANSTIWPLYHDSITSPAFRRDWWESYVRVNERFAAVASAQAADRGCVWVNDYHLQLVPALLRARRPDLHLGFFLHVPVPEPEIFRRLPEREQVLRGICGADLVGVQCVSSVRAFLRLVRRVLDTADVEVDDGGAVIDGRRVRVAHFPASVEVARIEAAATTPQVRARAAKIRAALGGPDSVILAVERLDYTKGIVQRLAAYRGLLSDGRVRPPRTVMIQVLPPSRQAIRGYRVLRRYIGGYVNAINAEFGPGAVHYWDRAFSLEELVPLYLAADVMAVTPLRDGMNLVAKEYVAARVDERGALVLSEFAGAAEELDEAYLVNPFDVEALGSTLWQAIRADARERSARMRAMRTAVRGYSVLRWGRDFLAALTGAARLPVA
jgi:trehalose 6-phosphate synthase